MKKIDLNVDPTKGDVLSSEELKSVFGSFSNSGSESGEIIYICECTFTNKDDETWKQDVPIHMEGGIPDCEAICDEACTTWNDDREGSCVNSKGVLKSGPGA